MGCYCNCKRGGENKTSKRIESYGDETEEHNRIRELEHWSRIKTELDDGSFDTVDPNTHQQVSLPKRFEHDMKALTPGTSASEARNIIGLHATAARIEQTRIEQDKKERLTAASNAR